MKATAVISITNAASMSLTAREAMSDWLMAIAVSLVQNGKNFPKVFRRGYISERKPPSVAKAMEDKKNKA